MKVYCAVYDKINKTLTFKSIESEIKDDDFCYEDEEGNIGYLVPQEIHQPEDVPWNECRDNVNKIIINSDFIEFTPSNLNYWFQDFNKVESINGLQFLNCENVKYMSSTFADMANLKELSIKNSMPLLVKMNNCFAGCESLEQLDLSGLKDSPLHNMAWCFANCSSLEELDLTYINIKYLEWIEEEHLFDYASCVENIFLNCSNLKTIYVTRNWIENEAVLNCGFMFAGCDNLEGEMGSRPDDPEYDSKFARIDWGEEKPGYFTYKSEDGE